MKFYHLINNKKYFINYKMQLDKLNKNNILSESDYAKYIKDLDLMKKSFRHNLMVIKSELNSNIYFLMSKGTKANSFENPLNGFELKSSRQFIDIDQINSKLGFAKCLFLIELQGDHTINEFLVQLNVSQIKESFGSLENAESLYKAANLYYNLNKNNTGNWIDVTRYFFQYEEIIKQYSYINFNKNQYYPFKLNTFEYDEFNVAEMEATKISEEFKSLDLKKEPEEL